MTARPFVVPVTPADVLARLLADQPAVTGVADSEQRERSRGGPLTVADEPRAARHNAAQYGVTPFSRPIPGTRGDWLDRIAERRREALARARGRGGAPLLETQRSSFPKREQLGTSFSTGAVELDESGSVLAEILADDPRAHFFRRDVARHLEPLWPRRAVALLSCGEAGARCDCGDCGAAHVLPYRCGARSCPTCARTASAIACERIAQRAELAASLHLAKWEGPHWVDKHGELRHGRPWGAYAPAWRMLTLTTRAKATAAERYEPETLRRYVLAVRRSWGKFWRSTAWGKRVRDVSASGRPTKRARRDTLFAIGIEVAPGGMVHLHAAIYGERIEHSALLAAWKAACDVGGGVEVHLMRRKSGAAMQGAADAEGFRDALREVLKYVSKGDKEPGKRAERAAAVEYALRRIRRVELGGALRFVPTITEKDVATEQRSCEACGGAGSWRWRGMRAATYVRRNKGFGLSHIVDDADAEALRAADKELAYRRADALQEDWRAHEREKRPGGAFYGGAPPPWMDDPDYTEDVRDDTPVMASCS